MRYLKKTAASKILEQAWRYVTKSHRTNIRDELIQEQSGYCTYTERFLEPIHAIDIEHFDNRLKNMETDDYWNWYAVLHWLNLRKRKIEKFSPLLVPHSIDLNERIQYANGQFSPHNPADLEASNLIEFLGWNDPTLARTRNIFIKRKKDELETFFDGDIDAFREYMRSDPENLSYRTALEVELGITFD